MARNKHRRQPDIARETLKRPLVWHDLCLPFRCLYILENDRMAFDTKEFASVVTSGRSTTDPRREKQFFKMDKWRETRHKSTKNKRGVVIYMCLINTNRERIRIQTYSGARMMRNAYTHKNLPTFTFSRTKCTKAGATSLNLLMKRLISYRAKIGERCVSKFTKMTKTDAK